MRDFNFNCATNAWLGNTWGPAGFSHDCTSTGGSQVTLASTATATSSPDATAAATDAKDVPIRRGRRQ